LLTDAAAAELPGLEQMRGILADVFGAELVGRTVEVTREFLDAPQVGARRALGIVAAHEFIGHLLA
jgi:hypothetical protein